MTMQESDIQVLREALAIANASGSVIIWKGVDGDTHVVRSVPNQKLDPDKTGVADYVAFLEGGHIDLSDIDPRSFLVALPLFANSAEDSK